MTYEDDGKEGNYEEMFLCHNGNNRKLCFSKVVRIELKLKSQ